MNGTEVASLNGRNVIVTNKFFGDVRLVNDGNLNQNNLKKLEELTKRKVIFLNQVHSNSVYVHDGAFLPCPEADAAIASDDSVAISVFSADCPTIGFSADNKIFGAIHCGWRGLLSGVVENCFSHVRKMGATNIYAILGPHICVDCYEFSNTDAIKFESKFGTDVTMRSSGKTYLNMTRVIKIICEKLFVNLNTQIAECSAHSGKFFSYRKEKSHERFGLIIF